MGELESLDDRARRELEAERQAHDANVLRIRAGEDEKFQAEAKRHFDRITEIVKDAVRRALGRRGG